MNCSLQVKLNCWIDPKFLRSVLYFYCYLYFTDIVHKETFWRQCKPDRLMCVCVRVCVCVCVWERERERERRLEYKEGAPYLLYTHTHSLYLGMCVCVWMCKYVCVRERERESMAMNRHISWTKSFGVIVSLSLEQKNKKKQLLLLLLLPLQCFASSAFHFNKNI